MGIPSGIDQKRTCVRIRTLGLVIFLGGQAVMLAPSRTPPAEQTKQAAMIPRGARNRPKKGLGGSSMRV